MFERIRQFFGRPGLTTHESAHVFGKVRCIRCGKGFLKARAGAPAKKRLISVLEGPYPCKACGTVFCADCMRNSYGTPCPVCGQPLEYGEFPGSAKSQVNEVKYHEFINSQIIFKYPRQWQKCAVEVGMLFVPPDSQLLEDPRDNKREHDLGLWLGLLGMSERDKGRSLSEVLQDQSSLTTTNPAYPRLTLLSQQAKHVEGAQAAMELGCTYQIGMHIFCATHVIALKRPCIYMMRLFGTPVRFSTLGNAKDVILDSLQLLEED